VPSSCEAKALSDACSVEFALWTCDPNTSVDARRASQPLCSATVGGALIIAIRLENFTVYSREVRLSARIAGSSTVESALARFTPAHDEHELVKAMVLGPGISATGVAVFHDVALELLAAGLITLELKLAFRDTFSGAWRVDPDTARIIHVHSV
jgi:hypothetical protein